MIGMSGGDEMLEAASVMSTLPVSLKTDEVIGNVIKAVHTQCVKDFTAHMSRISAQQPDHFSHMYEWGMVGLPNAKLWKHVLRGTGKQRKENFEFLPSKTIVPVNPLLKQVGVKKRHRFAMKAPVMEYALPVTISPKLAKVLVYLYKAPERGAPPGRQNVVGNIVYRRDPVEIEGAGSSKMWGEFTAAYTEWWSGTEALESAERVVKRFAIDVETATKARLKKIKGKVAAKSGNITWQSYDPELDQKLRRASQQDFMREAANRTR